MYSSIIHELNHFPNPHDITRSADARDLMRTAHDEHMATKYCNSKAMEIGREEKRNRKVTLFKEYKEK